MHYYKARATTKYHYYCLGYHYARTRPLKGPYKALKSLIKALRWPKHKVVLAGYERLQKAS